MLNLKLYLISMLNKWFNSLDVVQLFLDVLAFSLLQVF